MKFIKRVKSRDHIEQNNVIADVDSITENLRQRFPDKKNLVRAVAADVYYAGEAEILANDALIERLFQKWESKKHETDAKAGVAADNPNLCPLCSLPTKPIMLDQDRKASWCPQHFVVFPCKDEK